MDTLNSTSFGFFYLRNSISPLRNSLGHLDSYTLFGFLLLHLFIFYSWNSRPPLRNSHYISTHFGFLLWDLFRFYTAMSGAAAAGGTGLNPIHCGFIPVSPVLWLSPRYAAPADRGLPARRGFGSAHLPELLSRRARPAVRLARPFINFFVLLCT